MHTPCRWKCWLAGRLHPCRGHQPGFCEICKGLHQDLQEGLHRDLQEHPEDQEDPQHHQEEDHRETFACIVSPPLAKADTSARPQWTPGTNIAPGGGLPLINVAALNLRGLEDRTWDVEWTSVLFKPTTLGYRIAAGTPFDTGPGLIFPSNTTLTHRFKGNRSSLFQLREGPGPATNTSIRLSFTTFFQDTLTVYEMGCLDPTFQLKIVGSMLESFGGSDVEDAKIH
ncbi:unnamed protein product [Symbiodinium sp. KB8]|nr:unnamed protein product [Symbiodinium sp. KB8]